jgi:hypothetical protein
MTWRGPRTANDPLLTTHHWRKVVRPYWIALRLPCARCHRMIDYDGPRFIRSLTGRRTINPRALVVGHIVSRNRAKRMGWTEDQINALSNTRPECQDCSNKSGAREGNQMQRLSMKRSRIDTSRRW